MRNRIWNFMKLSLSYDILDDEPASGKNAAAQIPLEK